MQSLAAKHFPPTGAAEADLGPSRSRWRTAAAVLMGALLLAGLVSLARYSNRELHRDHGGAAAEEPPVYLPDIRFLRLASLGYDNVLADVLWFRTINYFGAHFRGNRLYPWLARMCDLVTDMDPRAEHVYRFAGFILPWEAQLPDEGIRLLEKGVRQFPDSWQLNFYLGFSKFYFRDDLEGALPYMRKAAELPGAHAYVTRLAAMMYTQKYGTDTAREFLVELRDSGGAGGMEGVIDERLKDIELTEHARLLETGVARYRERFGKDPSDLTALVDSGVIERIPDEPFGHHYVWDAQQGEVRSSSGRRPLRAYDSSKRKKILSGDAYRDE